MPNLIEQQDLLKGLTDDRLARLMQQPSGDMPPFLVAAEAQRREAIRQQYTPSGKQESVVDTLTKSLAKTPENLQAPAQTPPQMPQPMPQPQMRAGGAVQRYYGGGQVEPMWSLPDYGSALTGVIDYVGGQAKGIYDWATMPYGETPKAQPAESTPAPGAVPPTAGIPELPDTQIVPGRFPFPDKPPARPVMPRNKSAGTADTSPENRQKVTNDEMRERLKGLYADEGVSNWEKAQKWFAMSEQFFDPAMTTGQSIAGAARAFAEGAGAEAADSRAAARDQEEALFKYDLAKQDEEARRQAEAEQQKAAVAQNRIEAIKYQSEAAVKDAELYRRAADDAADKLNKRITALVSAAVPEDEIAKDPDVIAQQRTVEDANRMMQNAILQARRYRSMVDSMYGVDPGFEMSDGDSITRPNS